MSTARFVPETWELTGDDARKTLLNGGRGKLMRDAFVRLRAARVQPREVPGLFDRAGVVGGHQMGQIERALNRLYGVEKDRPTTQKYVRAFLLAVTAGGCATLAFAMAAFGGSINGSLNGAWNILRWPLALALITAAIALLLRWSPRHHRLAWSWLAFGSTLAVFLWAIATLSLSLFFSLSSSFGRTYGPLAGAR